MTKIGWKRMYAKESGVGEQKSWKWFDGLHAALKDEFHRLRTIWVKLDYSILNHMDF